MKPVVLLYEPNYDDAIALLKEKCGVRFAASLEEEALLEQKVFLFLQFCYHCIADFFSRIFSSQVWR